MEVFRCIVFPPLPYLQGQDTWSQLWLHVWEWHPLIAMLHDFMVEYGEIVYVLPIHATPTFTTYGVR